MELVTSHLNADFDAFSSMVAASRLYPGCLIALPGAMEKRLRDFTAAFGEFGLVRLKDIELAAVTRVIIVDTKSSDRIGQFAALVDKEGMTVHIYDHHEHGDSDLHGEVEVIEKVGATATIFTEMLKERGVRPEPIEATLLMTGIYEETGSLSFPSTTERDLLAAAQLLKWGASLKVVAEFLRAELTAEEVDLLSELGHSASTIYAGGLKVITARASRDGYMGDAAQFAGKLLEMEAADASFVILRMEGRVLVVGRSRAPELSASDVLAEIGGGGHPSAASATVDDQPLELIEETIAGLVRAHVRAGKTASDVMTKPVITVEAPTLMREAQTMLTKFGVNVLPVVEGGRFLGLLAREIVEKAIMHGFRKSAVREFADSDVISAAPETPLREIESSMVEKNRRFVPVLEGEAIVGAITRTDLLRVMYEDYLRRSGIAGEEGADAHEHPRRSTAALLQNRYPREIFEAFKLAGEVGRSLGMDVYLVGGSVRDMMRGRENLDIDLVVEGDGIEFSRAMTERLGGRMKSHERFRTAKIIAGKLRLDVATARTEYYESPAALPRVEMSSIKKDLYRRDFTVNTLAVKLSDPEFGRLVDYFGGMRDLKDKTIRVLHNLSLVEDPTRAFRAVRFAERFGFKISRHTEELIRSALRLEIFTRLSGSRLYEELMLVFGEPEPVDVIARLDHYGLLGVIHPALKFDERMHAALTAVHDTLSWFDLSFTGEKVNRNLLYLMGLLGGLPSDDEREAALRRLSAPKRVGERLMRDIAASRETSRRMPLVDPALIRRTLSEQCTECVLYVMALTEDQAVKMEVSNYLLRLRREKPMLRGSDLKALGIEPGPVYSDLLDAVLAERLRGNIETREDELNFIRTRIGTARG